MTVNKQDHHEETVTFHTGWVRFLCERNTHNLIRQHKDSSICILPLWSLFECFTAQKDITLRHKQEKEAVLKLADGGINESPMEESLILMCLCIKTHAWLYSVWICCTLVSFRLTAVSDVLKYTTMLTLNMVNMVF